MSWSTDSSWFPSSTESAGSTDVWNYLYFGQIDPNKWINVTQLYFLTRRQWDRQRCVSSLVSWADRMLWPSCDSIWSLCSCETVEPAGHMVHNSRSDWIWLIFTNRKTEKLPPVLACWSFLVFHLFEQLGEESLMHPQICALEPTNVLTQSTT